MIGLTLPDVDVWSDRVVVALGQNPNLFTGPGTNTYLVRNARERELLGAVEAGLSAIPDIVARVYAAYPASLHGPARQSVCSHLVKLEREGRVLRRGDPPIEARWSLA
jgi:hypothetical protein